MTILLFLFGVAVAAGLFFILADILKLPRLSTEKALLSAGRAEKKRMKSLDAIFLGWAIKLSKYIRMDEYKRHRLERTLSAAGMDMTPEVYLAYTILKPAAALLAVIPCLLIFPLLSPIVVLLSIPRRPPSIPHARSYRRWRNEQTDDGQLVRWNRWIPFGRDPQWHHAGVGVGDRSLSH